MRKIGFAFAVGVSLAMAGCATIRADAAGRRTPAVYDQAALADAVAYVKSQNTTGFLVMQRGRVLTENNWPAPAVPSFGIFVYGKSADGQLLEDVASQQKSFVSVLVGVAIDKGLIDVDKPVSTYLGAGWSKAGSEHESAIRVIDVLTMTSGLDEKFAYEAPPGTRFFYNTPVYAITKAIVAAAAKEPIEEVTRDWLTAPLGMNDTAWRKRPGALADVGNPTGLVTTPRDIALFGRMVLGHGMGPNGRRIVSRASLDAMFAGSRANPSYGRLWWLNDGAYSIKADGTRREGHLIPSAPADTVAALGFLERRLYVVPSLDLVVVRTGASVEDKQFDEHLWQRLARAVR